MKKSLIVLAILSSSILTPSVQAEKYFEVKLGGNSTTASVGMFAKSTENVVLGLIVEKSRPQRATNVGIVAGYTSNRVTLYAGGGLFNYKYDEISYGSEFRFKPGFVVTEVYTKEESKTEIKFIIGGSVMVQEDVSIGLQYSPMGLTGNIGLTF